MAARIELKNQALESKINQLSLGRDVSFEQLEGNGDVASPLGKFHRPETLIGSDRNLDPSLSNQNTAPKKKYTLLAEDFDKSGSDELADVDFDGTTLVNEKNNNSNTNVKKRNTISDLKEF